MERKGICKNVGICSQAGKVQVITDDDAEFVCSECGEPLEPYKEEEGGKKTTTGGDGGGRKPNGKLIGMILGAVVVLGGLGYGGYSIYDSNQKAKQEKLEAERAAAEADAQRQEAEAAAAEAERLKAEAEKALQGSEEERAAELARVKMRADSVLTANDKLLTDKAKTLKKEAKEKIESLIADLRAAVEAEDAAKIYELESAINAAWVGAEKVVTGGGSVINLGWGTYNGPVSGGKSGMGGTITVNRSYTIDLKKASGETVTVNSGDKIVNAKVENGQLRQGEIRFADGRRKFVSGL